MATSAAPMAQENPTPRKVSTLRLYDALEALDILDELIAEHGERIAAGGGDIESIPEIAELLAFAENQFEAAVERWGLKIRTLLAESEGARVERDRLTLLVKSKENAAIGLKSYLKRMLEARNIQKVQTPLVRVRIQKNGQPSVRCTSDGRIEELYATGYVDLVDRRETFALNRDAILKVVEEGKELPEGVLVEKGTHLRVE